VNSQIIAGLEISLISIVVLFATMGVLVLVMSLLSSIFRDKEPAPEPSQESPLAADIHTDDEDEKTVVAIAAALTHLRSLGMAQSGLGDSLKSEPGSWWVMGRMEAAQAAGVVKAKEE